MMVATAVLLVSLLSAGTTAICFGATTWWLASVTTTTTTTTALLRPGERVPDWFGCVALLPRGHLANAKDKTQLGELLALPATAATMLLNGVAYVWQHCLSAPVAVSTADVLERREYWRSAAAVFSHGSPWHLLMNVSSLQNLGAALEPRLGSVAFATQSFAVLVLAEALASLIDVVRSSSEQKRLGFSGILFAWMVLAVTLQGDYCLPLNVCFATYELWGMRVNAAPLVLAVAIQVVVPNASLVGHAAGALVGFPLAWGLLRGVSPTTLLVALALVDRALHDSSSRRRLPLACAVVACFLVVFGAKFDGFVLFAAVGTALAVALADALAALGLALLQTLSFAALAGTARAMAAARKEERVWSDAAPVAVACAAVNALAAALLVSDLRRSADPSSLAWRLHDRLRQVTHATARRFFACRRCAPTIPFSGAGHRLGSTTTPGGAGGKSNGGGGGAESIPSKTTIVTSI